MKMTPRTEDLPHGAERLNSLAAELAAVDEQCYRAAVEELYMDASGELAEAKAELDAIRKDRERLRYALNKVRDTLADRGFMRSAATLTDVLAESDAAMEIIVHLVNCHDRLNDRLKAALERADKAIVALIDSRGCQLPEVRRARTEIKAALAAAKGGQS